MAGGRDFEPLYFEAGAASVLGIAAGHAGLVLSASPTLAAAAALSASTLAFAVLLRLAAPARLPLAGFAAAALDAEGELLLDQPLPLGELLLEDRLPGATERSRVVRLFDCTRLSDPGELQTRIERHLREVSRPAPVEESVRCDDSAALHRALAELRHSVR